MRKQKVNLKRKNQSLIQGLRGIRYRFLRNQIILCIMAGNSRIGEAGVAMSQKYEGSIEQRRMFTSILNKEFPYLVNRYRYMPSSKRNRCLNKLKKK